MEQQFSASDRQTVAVAAVGDIGRYLVEELNASPDFNVVAVSREASVEKLRHRLAHVETRILSVSTYTDIDGLVHILDETRATVLISTLNFDNEQYYDIHHAFLRACQASACTTRLIPSEWAGNIDDFPHLPPFYALSRRPFRELLRREEPAGDRKAQGRSTSTSNQKVVEWTLFGCGWLMDYFLPYEVSHITPVPEEFPIHLFSFSAEIRGTGDEMQSWTRARDVARAVVALLRAPRGTWEETTYVAGEWSTFKSAIEVLEGFYERKMTVEHKAVIVDDTAFKAGEKAAFNGHLDEWMVVGGTAVPREKTLRQREKYFKGISFLKLQDVLDLTQERGKT
ncbi:MAG: hypothetical protein M1831_006705 [Alyxoria varia]|nr:MAG: hypothetical protein M1831_006705 [Alyxoria varia]